MVEYKQRLYQERGQEGSAVEVRAMHGILLDAMSRKWSIAGTALMNMDISRRKIGDYSEEQVKGFALEMVNDEEQNAMARASALRVLSRLDIGAAHQVVQDWVQEELIGNIRFMASRSVAKQVGDHDLVEKLRHSGKGVSTVLLTHLFKDRVRED